MVKSKLLIFSILITVLFILSTVAFAQTDIHEEYFASETGDPDFDYYSNKIPLTDRMFNPSNSFTIIGGALCSSNPDYKNEGVVNANRLCYTNTNHIGVAYLIWEVANNGQGAWTPLHPISTSGNGFRIDQGDRKCVDITPGNYYYRQLYYCDDVQRSCSPYESVCQTAGGTKRQRLCTDTGLETVYVDWVDNSVGYCSGYTPPTPIDGGDSTGGDDGSDDSVTDTNQKGVWNQIAVPENVQPGDVLTAKATFTAQAKGTYYLEAGMVEEPASTFSVVADVSGSECDGDVHWAGKSIQLDVGDQATMTFKFIAREKPGIYPVVIGAYTGCYDNGGEDVSKEQVFVKVLGADGEEEDSGILSMPIIIILLGGLAIAYIYFKKKKRG